MIHARRTICATLLGLSACAAVAAPVDAPGGDASRSCATSPGLIADWSSGSDTLEGCALRVASGAQPLTLCWRPCTRVTLASGCTEADPEPWVLGYIGMERDGIGYFLAGAPAEQAGVAAILGDDGSVLAAFASDVVATGVPHTCGGGVAALAPDAWVVQLEEDRPDPSVGGVYLGFAGELHMGALSDVAAWSTPLVSEAGFGWLRVGETTSSLAAMAQLQNHEPRDVVLLDASGARHVAPLHPSGWVYEVAGIVGDRVVWLEDELDALIAVRRDPDGTRSALLDVWPNSVAAMGLDAARWIWVEQERPWNGLVYHLYTAPIDGTATALVRRAVPEDVTPGWNTLGANLEGAAFGHGLAVLWFSTPDRLELRVVDVDSGSVRVLTLPPTRYVLGVVVTGEHALAVVHTSEDPPASSQHPAQRWLRIDTDALPTFAP